MPFFSYRATATPANDYWSGLGANSLRTKIFTQPMFGKSTEAFFDDSTFGFAIDGVGDLKPPVLRPALHIPTNDVPDNYQPVE
ncbi:MAG: hypothetical protein ACXW2T_07640, partial [Allosphingosinicella sp.]